MVAFGPVHLLNWRRRGGKTDSRVCVHVELSPSFALKKSYVVYMGGHSHGPEITAQDLDRATNSHYELLGSYLGSHERAKEAIFYSYTSHINGFAAHLEDQEVEEISKHPEVVSIFLNRARKLHTTRSWEFLGLERDGNTGIASAWKKARYGEDTIIANLDTGVWPESQSFNDEGMGPVPSRWKGSCQNNTKAGVPCNKKLIGAKYFDKGFTAAVGRRPSESPSARDDDGHGSHTLSTAGGGFVPGANVFGFGNGTAKGGSPKARVAAYKVCWQETAQGGGGCYDADVLAAIDEAIHDGADVISMSIGGSPEDYLLDPIALGSFQAIQKGIVVVCSAGNDGPGLKLHPTLRHGSLQLGESLTNKALPKESFYPLIDGASAHLPNASSADANLCQANTIDPQKVKGKILLCVRGVTARLDKGKEAARAGAVGMILANDVSSQNEIIADPHVLPAAHISYSDGKEVFSYIGSTKYPYAYLTRSRTELETKPAPAIAAFSSRGPNVITPVILKPDITAPGVNIIAAFSEAVSSPFNIESGTSMSCPHVSGIAGLLKTLQPDWSPAAIKSAIMTTARSRDNNGKPISNEIKEKATPFDYGAGHLRPNRAMDPGLVYDLNKTDYLNFLCGTYNKSSRIAKLANEPFNCSKSFDVVDFNYPSITVPNLNGTVTLTRRIKNVGGSNVIYKAVVRSPPRISVTVEPKTLKFEKTLEEKEFKVTLKAEIAGAAIDYVFGSLLWTDEKHYVRILCGVLGGHSHGPEITAAHLDRATNSHYELLGFYMERSPMAYMTQPRTQVGTKSVPSIAAFSSKGPNAITPGILKPDITAPGVNIIAATGTSFAMESGTSMSCTHISGIADLLKTLHADGIPAAIKSAIMNVGGLNVTYNAVVKSPPDITVSVEPKTLKFETSLEEKEFKVTMKAKKAGAATDYVFGSLGQMMGRNIALGVLL
ncbi:hypothetical protein Syun_010647 [Stephania yunnanensis]|uniref:Subtilisin n=1 Tax=Stephania yunnanensis TaxID=152371 RepID=A0AAP0KGV9_9MAGN